MEYRLREAPVRCIGLMNTQSNPSAAARVKCSPHRENGPASSGNKLYRIICSGGFYGSLPITLHNMHATTAVRHHFSVVRGFTPLSCPSLKGVLVSVRQNSPTFNHFFVR